MLEIKTAHLKAALTHAAKSDISYYLNGVCLTVGESGMGYLMATDGARAFIGSFTANWTDGKKKGPFQILIPRATVTAAIKLAGKNVLCLFDVLHDGRYSLGGVQFAAINGKFPDINRVIPSTISGETAQYNPEFLLAARDALRVWHGVKKLCPAMQYNGGSLGVMTSDGAFAIVMPFVKTDDPVKPFQVI